MLLATMIFHLSAPPRLRRVARVVIHRLDIHRLAREARDAAEAVEHQHDRAQHRQEHAQVEQHRRGKLELLDRRKVDIGEGAGQERAAPTSHEPTPVSPAITTPRPIIV
jgi:hypothetical protein